MLNAGIEYENVISIGCANDSILISLKAQGQESDDDNNIGEQIINQLKQQGNTNKISVQGSLSI